MILTPEQVQEDPLAAPLDTTTEQDQPAVSEEPAHPSVMRDVLLAPFRGVEGALQDAYGLLDTLTADALPDWDNRALGESETTAGSVVEGIANFLTGFVPIAGWAGKVGKAAGLTSKLGKLATSAAAGAAADFAVFDGHEKRLSNLLREHAGLNDAVTGFLAADDSDPELLGRFKNSLEGLGAGALTDALLHSAKYIKYGRQFRMGVNAEAAGKAQAESLKLVEEQAVNGLSTLKKTPAATPKADDYSAPKIAEYKKAYDEKAAQIAKFDPQRYESGAWLKDPNLSFNKLVSTDADLSQLQELTAAKLREEIGKTPREGMEVIDAESFAAYKDIMGIPPETLLAKLRGHEAAVHEARVQARATVLIVQDMQQELTKLAQGVISNKPINGMSTEQMSLAAAGLMQRIAGMKRISKGFGTEFARALNDRKYVNAAYIESGQMATQMLDSLGGSSFAHSELEKVLAATAGKEPHAAAKAAVDLASNSASLGDRLMRAHNELWLNSVLSGTTGFMVDVLGNTTSTLWQPLEQAIGGAFQLRSDVVKAALKNYVYLGETFMDTLRGVLQLSKGQEVTGPFKGVSETFKQSEETLFNNSAFNDTSTGPAITAKNILGNEDTTLAHAVNWFGEFVRLPQRFRMTADEFFKQMNYRAAAKTELYYRGMKEGLEGDALSNYIKTNFENTVTAGGRMLSEGAVVREAQRQAKQQGLTGGAYRLFIDEYKAKHWNPNNSALAQAFDTAKYAEATAKEATFSADLGAFGKGVQSFARSHPIAQLLVPFVKTPTNLLKWYSDRALSSTGLIPGVDRLQARNMAELASPDALVRSKAVGRIGAGQMLLAGSVFAALNGSITGKGPVDEAEAAVLKQTGWQPYSIKFNTAEGPLYVSYKRLDPLATFLGLAADWGESAKRQDAHNSGIIENTLQSMGVALSNNIMNKSYLTSLAQVVDALSQAERKFATWSRARAASYIPSFIAQFRVATDEGDTMHEIRSFWDASLNRIPGAQGLLEAKRNILGEKIDSDLAQTPLGFMNPFVMSKAKNDVVFTELAKLNHGLQPPSSVVNGVIDLVNDHKTADGRSAYDRMLELQGQVRIGGKTLRESLHRLVTSRSYQKLALTDPQDKYQSPRLREVRRLISSYTEAAKTQLQREVPSIQQALRQVRQDQMSLRRGQQLSAMAR